MIRIGITGQAGFVGTHLFNTLGLQPDKYERIPFEDRYFEDMDRLRAFAGRCDVIVHLAAVNRHPDPQELYRTNIRLVERLIEALEAEKAAPHVLFSSSTQEERDNEYGRSKREGRSLLEAWAERNGASFTGLVVPNVFGPFCRPNYNSFIATFAHKLTHGETPEVLQDAPVRLIYVGSLTEQILASIDAAQRAAPRVERVIVPHDFERNVTEILHLFEEYRAIYFERGIIPTLRDRNEVNLFNTFRSYIDADRHFPVALIPHADQRGLFVETMRLGAGGQVSFSTTVPGITRGNHFHTRKIERFAVIRGQACIRLRRIGTEEITEFRLDGQEPSYVDMPVWYTHNITNTGTDELYTIFWINECYDPSDPDTYFEAVEPAGTN